MEKQRNHAHDVAVAAQAAVDVLNAMIARLDKEEPEAIKLSDLGLPDPEPMEEVQQ